MEEQLMPSKLSSPMAHKMWLSPYHGDDGGILIEFVPTGTIVKARLWYNRWWNSIDGLQFVYSDGTTSPAWGWTVDVMGEIDIPGTIIGVQGTINNMINSIGFICNP